jgi:hypothetical protein
VPLAPERASLPQLMAQAPANGWVRAHFPGHYALLARGGAEPLTIEFPVPNGTYEVSLAMHGACEVVVEGGPSRRELHVPARDGAEPPRNLRDLADVSIGPVEITQERFRATIFPLAASTWLLVRRVGFAVRDGAGSGDAEANRERRLRALGYVGD